MTVFPFVMNAAVMVRAFDLEPTGRTDFTLARPVASLFDVQQLTCNHFPHQRGELT